MRFIEYTLDGKDGIDLLQRISASDFRLSNVKPIYQDGLILNPQGKIIAYFQFLLKNESSVSIHIPESKEELAEKKFLEILDQYTFAEKYTLTKKETIDFPENEIERVQILQPRVDFEFKTDGNTSPLDINLLGSVADQKGCYPGQEVIEKVISIGQAPKKLCRVEFEGDANQVTIQGEAILDGEHEVGTLTTIVGNQGLAILRKMHAKNDHALKTKSGCTLFVRT